MTRAQKWSIVVGTGGLLVVIAAFLQWFSMEGESISGIEFGGVFFVIPGGLVALGAGAAFHDRETPALLSRLFFLALYGVMGLFVYALPLVAMDTRYAFDGPGIPLTVFAVAAGGCTSFVWLLQPVPKQKS